MPWNDFLIAPDVLLTPLDPQMTVVDFAVTAPAQTARGSAVSDGTARGRRRSSSRGKRRRQHGAGRRHGSAGAEPLVDWRDGIEGRLRRPAGDAADLPSASGYTYAVELSADEAIQVGADEDRLRSALAFYVENFIGFPWAARSRPATTIASAANGWRARTGASSACWNDGSGRAKLDIDGDGLADNATALAALGVTDGERQNWRRCTSRTRRCGACHSPTSRRGSRLAVRAARTRGRRTCPAQRGDISP